MNAPNTTYNKPIKRTYLDYTKMGMWYNGNGFSARLNWSVLNNNPRCTVWFTMTDESGQKVSKQKFVGFGPLEFGVFLRLFRQVINFKPTADKREIEQVVTKNDREGNQEASLAVGKRADGVVYISIRASDVPRADFEFQGIRFLTFLDSNTNTPLPASTVSIYMAASLVDALERITPVVQAMEFDPTVGSGQGTAKKKEYPNRGYDGSATPVATAPAVGSNNTGFDLGEF